MLRILTALILTFSLTHPSNLTATEIKNVLFLISDDLRADTLACYGDKLCKTPNIDKLAARGMLFTHAYCQGTWCAPSRTSLMHSRYLDSNNITLGQLFKNNQFYSARVGKIFHMRVPGDIIDGTDGDDVPQCWSEIFNSQGPEAHTPGDYACLNLNIFTNALENRQSTKMPHRMFVTVQYQGDGSDQPDYKTASKTIELLQKHKNDRFFIAAGFVRPHYPMVAPKQYFEPYPYQDMILPPQITGDLNDIPKIGQTKSRSAINGIDQFPDNQQRMWSAYYATVTFMDEQVGRILNELDRLGLSASTAVVFTSDHGYHLGDHTYWQKADVHEKVTHVPLIIAAPNFQTGTTNSIVELVDIYPTLAELTGLKAPTKTQGTSLIPILTDPKKELKHGAISFDKGTSWRSKDWSYILYKNGEEELYDMRNDPHQITNLAKTPKHNAVRLKMANALKHAKTQINDN